MEDVNSIQLWLHAKLSQFNTEMKRLEDAMWHVMHVIQLVKIIQVTLVLSTMRGDVTCLQIMDGKMERMTESFTTGASRDFISKSLRQIPKLRLGCMWKGTIGLKDHIWFKNFQWSFQ